MLTNYENKDCIKITMTVKHLMLNILSIIITLKYCLLSF